MRDPIVLAVADVLEEQDADAARALLARALLDATGTELAARVHVAGSEAVVLLHGDVPHPPAAALPSAADIRKHPLYRYRAETGEHRATTLPEVIRAGWCVDETTLGIFEALRLPLHQAELVVTGGDAYRGWTLVAPSRISVLQLRPLIEHERLLRGLDRHIELLARLHVPPAAGTAAAAIPLTPRELMVLRLMHASCTAGAIGARLGVSPRTVHKHQEHLYRKLGARDRLEAVLIAQRAGLLPTLVEGEQTGLASIGRQPAVQAASPATMPCSSAAKSASPR